MKTVIPNITIKGYRGDLKCGGIVAVVILMMTAATSATAESTRGNINTVEHCITLASGGELPAVKNAADPTKKGSVKQNALRAATAEVEACIKLLKAVDTLRKSNNNIPSARANNTAQDVGDSTDIREEVESLRPLLFDLRNDVRALQNPPVENSPARQTSSASAQPTPTVHLNVVGEVRQGGKRVILIQENGKDLRKVFLGDNLRGKPIIEKDGILFWGDSEL